MNTIHLIGVEDVSRAGHNIAGAAESMLRAAATFEAAADHLIRSMNDAVQRMEAAAEKMTPKDTRGDGAAKPAERAQRPGDHLPGGVE